MAFMDMHTATICLGKHLIDWSCDWLQRSLRNVACGNLEFCWSKISLPYLHIVYMMCCLTGRLLIISTWVSDLYRMTIEQVLAISPVVESINNAGEMPDMLGLLQVAQYSAAI